MTWNFYINSIAVDEPQGWSDVVIKIARDDNWHGVFFEASASTLRFYGTGADMLKAEKQANVLAAQARFRAELVCGETVDILEGTFDFGTYIENFGTACVVEISIEKPGCLMTLRNRYDQKVDMQKRTSFNNITLLPQYSGLDFELELTAQKLQLLNEAKMSDAPISAIVSDDPNWLDSDGFNNYIGWISPPLPDIRNESFGTFNNSAIIDLAGPLDGVPNRPPYPEFPTATGTSTLLSDTIICELTDTVAEFRIKGTGSTTFSGSGAVGLTVKIFRLPNGLDGTIAINWIEEYASLLFSRTTNGSDTFDLSATVPLTINQGDFIYFGISTRGDSINNISNFTLEFDNECFYKLGTSSLCETSNADVSLINEAGARIIESLTDSCMTFKSDYYGRTDSEPYYSDFDGCGSLRVITNGLKIRKAETKNHFISFQEFFEGLRGIDNIGIGIEDNTEIPGKEWVRMEPVEYFYQNVKLLTLPFIPNAKSLLQPDMASSSIKVGYRNWEVQKLNGLTEFNSIKDFRTGLSTINNPIDISTDFVAGGIPIEITRQQSFAVSGKADTSYDNNTFIICTERSGYGYIVEKDNITSPANIFSPETVYNWRIRPMYNLMRWFKSIAQVYVNLSNSTSKLFFTSGTGNYIAEGRLTTPDPCDQENKVIAENDDLSAADYIVGGSPIWQPEIIQFNYPLSVSDYNTIKSNPYGYLYIQCGNGNFEKAFIKTIEYRPAQGQAAFTLIKKWP